MRQTSLRSYRSRRQRATSAPTELKTGNSIPTVTAGGPYNVPKQTPFKLTAAAQDADGDALTYDWQEFDLGPPFVIPPTGYVQDNDADGNARPIFRNYAPTASPSRTFPSLQYILDHANVPPPTVSCGPGNIVCLTDEILPSITRTMNFQVVVRDNRSGAGGVNSATSTVQVDGASGPFRVTSPNSPGTVAPQTALTVTWDVANTNSAPVSASTVNILLSTDGGATFPFSLAGATPNDGTQTVAIPNVNAAAARIKIEAVGNIFFDVSDADFTIAGCVPPPPGLVSWYRGQINATDSAGNNDGTANGNGFADAKVGKGFDIQNTAGITVADDSSLNLQSFTIEGWVRSSPFSGSKFIAAKSGLASLSGYEFGMIDGLLRFTLNGGAGGADLIDDANVADGGFHHVAATYDGTTMRVFLDGSLAAEKAVTTTLSFETSSGFVIGSRQSGILVTSFGGLIDELSIYGRALTESEIQIVFNSANIGKCVAGGVQISPISQAVNPGNTISFSASGGVPPFDFAFASNISGGSINPTTGFYTAGATLGTDVIRVTDGKTDVSFATIRITAPCIPGQKTWDGDGTTNNWSEAANWTCDQVPVSGDAVIFSGVSAKDATVDTNVSINSFNINNGYSGIITLSNGVSLTTTTNSTQNAGTINVGGGILNLGGNNYFLNGGLLNANFGAVNVLFFLNVAGGTFDGGSAALSIPVVDVASGSFISTSGTLVVSQNIQSTGGTLDLDNGTVYFNGFSNGAVSGISATFKNLTIGKGDNVGVSFAGTNIVSGTLTLTDGLLNTGTLEARGPVEIADTFGRTDGACCRGGRISERHGIQDRDAPSRNGATRHYCQRSARVDKFAGHRHDPNRFDNASRRRDRFRPDGSHLWLYDRCSGIGLRPKRRNVRNVRDRHLEYRRQFHAFERKLFRRPVDGPDKLRDILDQRRRVHASERRNHDQFGNKRRLSAVRRPVCRNVRRCRHQRFVHAFRRRVCRIRAKYKFWIQFQPYGRHLFAQSRNRRLRQSAPVIFDQCARKRGNGGLQQPDRQPRVDERRIHAFRRLLGSRRNAANRQRPRQRGRRPGNGTARRFCSQGRRDRREHRRRRECTGSVRRNREPGLHKQRRTELHRIVDGRQAV
ncbi:MAG: hypothetical protein IPJ30_12315 [Acidobacteria bacterium]|nr:hypothetical protein [Acidobacteriota bacterium]